VTCLVYNKTVPDDDFIKSKHVIKTQVFLLVVLTDKIKSICTSFCMCPKQRSRALMLDELRKLN
jgi:hypothetical protein